MTNHLNPVRVGTRGSALARVQTQLALVALHTAYPDLLLSEQIIRTVGDQVSAVPLPLVAAQASGVFTSALEKALLANEIDLAVHSAKDLPTTLTPGLMLGAYLPRADVRDVLISRDGFHLVTLPDGATVGTSSPRRAAQLHAVRPDIIIANLRGNIDSRIAAALDTHGAYDAIVLAYAGLERLVRTPQISEILSLAVMLPAPAQGAIVIQTRDEPRWRSLLAPLDDLATSLAVTAERAFLHVLDAGCALPAGALALLHDRTLSLQARVLNASGSHQINVTASGILDQHRHMAAQRLGEALADQALQAGARRLMSDAE